MNSADYQPFIKLLQKGVATARQHCPLILLIVALFFQNCASDNKKTPQPPPATTAAAPEPVSETPKEDKESPVGKSVEELRENKTKKIGTVPMGKDAELNSTVPAPPTKISGASAPKAGPPGYITKKDMILQAEPAPNSAKISTLNQYETVYILETIMTDEQGRVTEYPTWYRVERENKQKGWVVAKGVNAGGGG